MNTNIEDFWNRFKEQTRQPEAELRGAWAFGLGREMADDLARLVVKGEKTMTSSAKPLYDLDNEPYPEADGKYDIVLNGDNEPVAVIQNTSILRNLFYVVPEEVAQGEGEGDKTLEYWRRVHKDFWEKEFAMEGLKLDLDTLEVITEVFQLIYKEGGN
jgi:uncharacterized protein YhfF